MRETGLYRRMDDLGRVVIPREIRNKLNLKEGDEMHLFVDDNGVYFRRTGFETRGVDKINELERYIEEGYMEKDVTEAEMKKIRKHLEELKKLVKHEKQEG